MPGAARSAVNPPQLPPGYTLARKLGESPLSEVFLVVDDAGDHRALKVLRGSAARDPRIRERWRREAQLLEEIDHPNLVKSFGPLEVDGRPGLWLEYIDGPSLRDRLREGPLEWEQAARLGVQVARALERLHRHGAVHRDVKPHNILLDRRRGAVLADLGLVRRREDPTLTRQGAALGSPAYMSPEQARDPSDTDAQADVYSLGASLHHALSGEPPFLGQGVGEVIHRVLHEDPEDLPEAVPDGLARVVATAMAKERERRYARAIDLRNDLGRVLMGVAPRLLTQDRLRRRWRALAGVAAAVTLGVGAWVLWPEGSGEPDVDLTTQGDHLGEEGGSEGGATNVGAGVASRPEIVEPRAADQAFLDWVREYEVRWRSYLAQGQLDRALEEVETVRDLPLPAQASERFAQLRRAMVRDAEQGILAQAEELAGQAERALGEARRSAERGLEEDPHLDLESWSESVEERWTRQDLPVEQLPLRPGGADPQRLLASARSALRDRQLYLLTERASDSIPFKRERVHAALRARELETALEEWDSVDARLLPVSPEGRREAARLEVLRNLSVSALYEEPAARVRARLAAERADQDWSLAQVHWCRGELDQALSLMRPLAAERWESDRAPGFWIAEWERERQVAMATATSAGPAPDTPEPSVEPVDPRPPDPVEELAARWRAEGVGAEVNAVGGGVEILWESPKWGAEWEYSLPWERGRWKLEAWRVTWQLDPDEDVPRLVEWLDQVRLSQASRAATPVVRVGSTERRGWGILPGAAQVLAFRDGTVWLDGLEVATLAAPRGRRLEVSAQAQPGFEPDQVWLRVVPR